MNAENPFPAPPAEAYSTDAYDGLASDGGLTPPATRQRMEWGQSISYLFAEPNWIVTLLLASVCARPTKVPKNALVAPTSTIAACAIVDESQSGAVRISRYAPAWTESAP